MNVLDLGLSQKTGSRWLRPTGGFIIAAAFFFQQFTPAVGDATASTSGSNRSFEARHLPPTTWSSSLSGTTAYARLFDSPSPPVDAGSATRAPADAARAVLPNPADELRDLSGLPVEALADLVRVTRTSFHDWLRGRPITLRHERELLQALAVLKVAGRTKGQAGLRRWLLEPVAGTTTPFDLLRQHDYDTALGLALRVHAAIPTTARSGLDASVETVSGVAFNRMRRVASRWPESVRPKYKAIRSLDRGWKELEWAGNEQERSYSEHKA